MSRLSLLLVVAACMPAERETERPSPAGPSERPPEPKVAAADEPAAPEQPEPNQPPAEPIAIAPDPGPATPPVQPADLDPRVVALVQRVAAEYPQWGRVDDTFRFASTDCAAPMEPKPHLSDSDDRSTHGEKLFYLYALDADAYGARRSLTDAELKGVTQAIVKESFSAERSEGVGDAQRDGIAYRRGEPRDLFIMLRPKKKLGPTDEGWIYATVAADHRTVTSAGVVDSCATCHREAPNGRLFGPPASMRPDPH